MLSSSQSASEQTGLPESADRELPSSERTENTLTLEMPVTSIQDEVPVFSL